LTHLCCFQEREKLIRKGVITPFSKVDGFEKRVQSRPAERPAAIEDDEEGLIRRSIANAAASMSAINKARPTTKLVESSDLPRLEGPTRGFRQLRTPFKRVTADEGDGKATKARVRQTRTKRKRPQVDKEWRSRFDTKTGECTAVYNVSKLDHFLQFLSFYYISWYKPYTGFRC
jgi:DNA excision repair protein ERCC-6